jgi:phosphoserine phosphatase
MLKKLRAKRDTLLREAEGLKNTDGSFENDEKRAAFDVKMTTVEALNDEIRELEATDAPTATTEQPTAEQARRDEVIRRDERTRAIEIQKIAKLAGIDETRMQKFINDLTPLDEVRAEALAHMEREGARTRINTASSPILMGEDARDKQVRGVSAWLTQKAGVGHLVARGMDTTVDKIEQPGEFRGMTLLDLGRMFLERDGVNTRAMDKMRLAQTILEHRSAGPVGQGTTDFTVAFENVMNKVLVGAYRVTPDTCLSSARSARSLISAPRTGIVADRSVVLDNADRARRVPSTRPMTDAEKATNQRVDRWCNIVAL